MTKAAREILTRALELSSKQRANLARKLLQSLDDEEETDAGGPLDPEFAKEIERRLKDKPPPGGWPTADEVLDRISRELKLPPRKPSARRRRG